MKDTDCPSHSNQCSSALTNHNSGHKLRPRQAVVEDYRKNKTIETFIRDMTIPYVDIEVKNVILDDLRQSPYSARIEFLKIYTNPSDHSEIKRERWTASVTYVFRDAVQNGEIQVNPLGMTVVKFRSDQAFD